MKGVIDSISKIMWLVAAVWVRVIAPISIAAILVVIIITIIKEMV
tara:strand:+ start:942 stop:1076 length:135 start_codon:yes stop_codon:yes gene_type:complete